MVDNSTTPTQEDSFPIRLPKLPTLSDLTNAESYNWKLDGWEGVLKTLLVICCSFAFFSLLQYTVRFYLFGKCTFRTFDYFRFARRSKRRRDLPSSTELEVVPPNKKFRICNEAVSLIHSVISGIWALYSIMTYPNLLTDINMFSHPVPKFLVYISFGYILHDLIELLVNERSIRIIELLFHHVVVIAAFLTTLITNMFLGVVVCGLLMEINSIFLHSRSLLNLYRQPKDSTAFKFVALLNILTFMTCRMAVSIYLLYWQITNMLGGMVWYHSLVTFLVIASLAVTNSILLYRVLSADGLLGKDRARRPTNIEQTPEFDELDNEDNGSDENGSDDGFDRRVSRTEATQTNDLNEATQTDDPTKALNDQPTVVVVHP